MAQETRIKSKIVNNELRCKPEYEATYLEEKTLMKEHKMIV